MVNHIKTECPKKHSYTEDNSYIDKNGNRHCRTCRRERMRVRREPLARVGRGINNSSKTHCPKGHIYDEENTIKYKKPSGNYSRHCRACARVNSLVQNVKLYGITVEQFNSLLEAQSSKCAICSREFWKECSSPNIDHDHECCPKQRSSCGNCVRGLLCANCNVGLGAFMDNPELLAKGANYLKSGTLAF
jgi:hypothetical protein